MNNYSFVVDLGKNQKIDRVYNQILFCSCGNKQKTKITVKRTILKNTETLYEDKHSIEQIKCSNCNSIFDIMNNLYGIKVNQKLLVEVSFTKEDLILNNKTLKILKKNKLFYYYDLKNDELKNFILTDFLIYDNKTKEIRLFLDESLLNFNLFGKIDEKNDFDYLIVNSKQNKIKKFNLNESDFTDYFFDFDETINYRNLETCFNYFDEILKDTYDYESLYSERFLINFKISSIIYEFKEKGKLSYFINQKDPFGSEKLIKKRLNVGDYLNKLIKLSNITFIFISFPSISSLYKIKGLDFILDAYHNGFFCPQIVLDYNSATNTSKILELCSKYYFHKNVFKSSGNISKKEFHSAEFKLSPIIIKNIKHSDDVLVLFQFFKNQNLSKSEIELLFTKFDNEDVIKVMSKIVSGANIRGVKLEIKHLHHILKNRLFDNSDEWLTIYYDTINTLKLIVDILDSKKNNNLTNNKYNNLTRISETKLFESKNYDKLKELHDEMFAIYRAMEDENKDLLFREIVKKYKNLNNSMNLFDFKVIPNLKELSQEGLVMKHCIYTYLNDIVKGSYLAIRIKDTISKEKATMGLKIEDGNLFLQQLKGYENSRPTALLIGTALNFCKENSILTDSNHLHKIDIQPNESLEKRMKNYVPKLKAIEIRKKMLSDK